MAAGARSVADLAGRMRREVLEYCVLGLLRDGDWGAYELVRTLSQEAGLAELEGTMYPVLAGMRHDGLVATIWRDLQPSGTARFYRITPEGTAALDAFVERWVDLRARVDACLGTGGAAAPADRSSPDGPARGGPDGRAGGGPDGRAGGGPDGRAGGSGPDGPGTPEAPGA